MTRYTLSFTLSALCLLAGGFLEHAKKGDVVVVRTQNGREQRYKFNDKDVVRGKNLEQNIRLLPGDTILVR
jgi:polysaccharide export outer membrane protein